MTDVEEIWQRSWEVTFHSNPLMPHLPRMNFIKRFLVTSPRYASDRADAHFLSAPFFKYTLNGYGRLETEEKHHDLPCGTGFLFVPGRSKKTHFRYPREAQQAWEWLHISFWGCGELAGELIERMGPVFDLAEDDPLLLPFWSYALTGMQEHAIGISAQDSAQLVTGFLAGLAQRGHRQVLAGRSQLLVEEAKNLILQELSRRPRMQDIAQRLSISPEHLNRIFRAETGITPLAFYQQQLIKRAKSLLVNPALSIKQLATNLGFSGSSQFVAMFTRQVGTSPNRYRASIHSSSPGA